MDDFNEATKEYNRLVLEACKDLEGITLHKMAGLSRRWGRFLQDGLHYTSTGQRKLWNNIRRALIHNLDQCHV